MKNRSLNSALGASLLLASCVGLVVLILKKRRSCGAVTDNVDLPNLGPSGDCEANAPSSSSWRSKGSVGSARSIGSIGSFCSIGSIASSFSIGSIASSCSIGSIGSFACICSVASIGSIGSFAGHFSRFSALGMGQKRLSP
jgi:hypothetical protein